MIRPGVCMVPFEAAFDHAYLQPKPTVKSWLALRLLGFTDVRLQFNVGGDETTIEAPVSPRPGVWDTTRFRLFIEPAFAAGMRINANYVIGAPVPAHQDAQFHDDAAFRFAREFGSMIDSYSFGNEPGVVAQTYEADRPNGDYMRDVYFGELFLPFLRGLRRAKFDAWVLGCDADSADIQQRFIRYAYVGLPKGAPDVLGVKCNEESIHPYGEVIDQSYSTLAAFKAVRSRRPWGITEINSREPGKLFDFTASIFANPDGCTRLYHLFEGNEVEYFEPVAGGRYSSFYSPNPIVNVSGRRYAELFAQVNGDPIRTTMPVRKRAVRK